MAAYYSSNRAPTDWPVWMRRIASPSRGATERILNFGSRFSGDRGIVSVNTNYLMGDFSSRSTAGPERIGCVAAA